MISKCYENNNFLNYNNLIYFILRKEDNYGRPKWFICFIFIFLFLSLDVLTTYLVYSIIANFYVCFSTFFFE